MTGIDMSSLKNIINNNNFTNIRIDAFSEQTIEDILCDGDMLIINSKWRDISLSLYIFYDIIRSYTVHSIGTVSITTDTTSILITNKGG